MSEEMELRRMWKSSPHMKQNITAKTYQEIKQ